MFFYFVSRNVACGREHVKDLLECMKFAELDSERGCRYIEWCNTVGPPGEDTDLGKQHERAVARIGGSCGLRFRLACFET